MRMRFNTEYIRQRILEAYKILYKVVYKTPLIYSYSLSKLSNGEIYLKLENLQRTGSFKVRGAYFKIWNEYLKGYNNVIAADPGNHGQGVAYSTYKLKISSTIVIPENAPSFRIKAIKNYGARIILHGENYEDAYEKALEIAREKDMPFIHPFEDPDLIAGHGTIGLELYEDLKNIDRVIVPIGGGGLISGISIALKNLKKDIKIIGVQPEGASALYKSFKKKRLIYIDKASSIADVLAIKRPGIENFKIINQLVDDIVTVSDDEIIKAMLLTLEKTKLVVEAAGTLGIAAILSQKINISKGNTVIILSGGNIDITTMPELIRKSLLLEKDHIILEGLIPNKIDDMKKLFDIISSEDIDILSINYNKSKAFTHPGYINVILEIRASPDSINEIINRMQSLGFSLKIL